ncbi:MAG: dTDP-4-dehydrorhamnose reductase [Geminicoccaceae bacterium]|nr:MAG: dTDP-4-dehydrorhamnose reductase [Geminicoccaceae bacterium]
MRVLVFGGSGQVGQALRREVWPADVEVSFVPRSQVDLADLDAIAMCIGKIAPDVVINAAAYTAVDRAENEPGQAYLVNAFAPGAMAAACARVAAFLIHISTDYVFDGASTVPYVEADPVGPLGVYGASKLAGELLIRERLPDHVILRTAWVYGATGNNFLRTMLRLGRERRELRVVVDQHGSPTHAAEIASALRSIAVSPAKRAGTFHLTGGGATTWHGFAEAIFEAAAELGYSSPVVAPIVTADYPTPARRPLHSVLDCRRIDKVYGVHRPSWRASLRPVVRDVLRAEHRASTRE